MIFAYAKEKYGKLDNYLVPAQPMSGPTRATQANAAVVTSHKTSHNDKFTHLTDDRSIQPTVTPRQRRHFGSRSISAEKTTILIR